MYTFKFDKEHIHYINEQIWEIKNNFSGNLDAYSKLSAEEHKFINKYIPDNAQNILDLGCGLGRSGTYLYNSINKDHQKHFVFCDSTVGAKGNGGTTKGNSYNDLEKTKSFITVNDVKNYQIVDFNKQKLSDIHLRDGGKFDIIMSMYSVGLHFPIETYLNELLKVIDNKTVLIFGIRQTMTYKIQNFEKFKKWFSSVEFVKGPREPYPCCDYLILNGPIVTEVSNDQLWKEYNDYKKKKIIMDYK